MAESPLTKIEVVYVKHSERAVYVKEHAEARSVVFFPLGTVSVDPPLNSCVDGDVVTLEASERLFIEKGLL